MESVEAERPFTNRELVVLETQIRTNLITAQDASAATVRQSARDALRLLRQVQRDRRFVVHLVRLAEQHAVLLTDGASQGSST